MKRKDLRRPAARGALVATLLLAAFGMTPATGPERNVNPNGFPSGEHYNLNIIGKNAEFTCAAPELDENGNPLYGNVVFVPENGMDIRIVMQSGRTGKTKTGETITGLFMWSGMICWDAASDASTATTFCRDAAGNLTPKGVDPCPPGSTEVTLYCRIYETPTWVFNIGDFVNYLWSANNSGLKLLQVRFYPRYQ